MGRGHDFDNCSTSSEYWYGSKLVELVVISGVQRFLAKSATICQINNVWLPTTRFVLDKLFSNPLILFQTLQYFNISLVKKSFGECFSFKKLSSRLQWNKLKKAYSNS